MRSVAVVLLGSGLALGAPALAAECEGAKPLAVGANNLVVAPRSDKLLAMINFAATLPSVPKAQQRCAVLATSEGVAKEQLAKPNWKRFAKLEVIVAIVENMDEYARPNYGGMKRLGKLLYERTSTGVSLKQEEMHLEP